MSNTITEELLSYGHIFFHRSDFSLELRGRMLLSRYEATDQTGYNNHYKHENNIAWSSEAASKDEFIKRFKIQHLTPFSEGGRHIDGSVRGVAIERMLYYIKHTGKLSSEIKIVDAGSGLGGLSVYLACLGYTVTGIEISDVACRKAEALSLRFGVSDKCTFLSESLDETSIEDSSIDVVIGLHTFHHFIKYADVPREFKRILKPNGIGIFADGFGENPFFRLFHDKDKMKRLGDVVLNKRLIKSYFNVFSVKIEPISWLSMIDKFIVRLFGWKFKKIFYKFSKKLYAFDRKIPNNRITLFLSGTILTSITNA